MNPLTKIGLPAAIGAVVGWFAGGAKGAAIGGAGTGAVAYATMKPDGRQDTRRRVENGVLTIRTKVGDVISPNDDTATILGSGPAGVDPLDL